MAAKGEVEVDKRPLQRMAQGVRDLDGLRLRFGAMAPDGGAAPTHTGRDGKRDGPTTARVLAWVEFGTVKMPERPIIRHVMAANRQEIAAATKEGARQASMGRSARPILEALGRRLADLTRQRMRDVDAVDTAQTLESIHHVVEE